MKIFRPVYVWKFSGLFRCEKFQAYLGVKISCLKFSGVKFFNPPNLAQFQPNLHVKILAWSHVKISGLKQVWFTCENRFDRFRTGSRQRGYIKHFIRSFWSVCIISKISRIYLALFQRYIHGYRWCAWYFRSPIIQSFRITWVSNLTWDKIHHGEQIFNLLLLIEWDGYLKLKWNIQFSC